MQNKSTVAFAVYILFNTASMNASAEGIFDFKPYVGLNTTYDDNIFRYSSPEQAKAATGSSSTSDSYVTTEAGLNVNLRLSRQLISLTAGINKNQFNRFKQLDSVGKSYALNWSWRLGNNLSGEIGSSESSSISSFNEFTNKTRNIRTEKRQFVSANWQFHPSWTARIRAENGQSENGEQSFNNLDRESKMIDAGAQYISQSGTLLSLDYRTTDSSYPNRTGSALISFGNESTQNEWIAGAAWSPTSKIRIGGQLSQVNIDYKNTTRKSFSGLNESLNLDYVVSAKTAVNFTAYKQVTANDDLIFTDAQSTGFSINPSYDFSEKLKFNASLGYVSRDSIGNTGALTGNPQERVDETTNVSISVNYLPTIKSVAQLSYTGAQRRTNTANQNYDFNTLNMSLRYNF